MLSLCDLQKIDSYQEIKDEIASLRVSVPLSMFCLDCDKLNKELCDRTEKLKERLIVYELEENRVLNKE